MKWSRCTTSGTATSRPSWGWGQSRSCWANRRSCPATSEDQQCFVGWSEIKGQALVNSVNAAYLKVVRWRRNVFNLPKWKAGEDFIEELTKLYCNFNDYCLGINCPDVVCTHICTSSSKTCSNIESSNHLKYLEKRILLWREVKLDELLCEGRAIQKRFLKK